MNQHAVRLRLVGPTGIPMGWTATVRSWEGVGEPFSAAVTLSLPEVDGETPDLIIYTRPGLPEVELDSVVEWAQLRLTRLFNPDGSDPDEWENLPEGRGLVAWARTVYLPPLVTTEDRSP